MLILDHVLMCLISFTMSEIVEFSLQKIEVAISIPRGAQLEAFNPAPAYTTISAIPFFELSHWSIPSQS
jgi:hypothetical protein